MTDATPYPARQPVILDFTQSRVWLPGDEGYEQRKAELDKLRSGQKMFGMGATPPEDWRLPDE